jgi:hypothetical protein
VTFGAHQTPTASIVEQRSERVTFGVILPRLAKQYRWT